MNVTGEPLIGQTPVVAAVGGLTSAVEPRPASARERRWPSGREWVVSLRRRVREGEGGFLDQPVRAGRAGSRAGEGAPPVRGRQRVDEVVGSLAIPIQLPCGGAGSLTGPAQPAHRL